MPTRSTCSEMLLFRSLGMNTDLIESLKKSHQLRAYPAGMISLLFSLTLEMCMIFSMLNAPIVTKTEKTKRQCIQEVEAWFELRTSSVVEIEMCTCCCTSAYFMLYVKSWCLILIAVFLVVIVRIKAWENTAWENTAGES